MAKIGCLKPFRGSWNGMKDIVLEDGEIAFITEGSKMIYFGNGTDKVENLTPFADISTLNNNINCRAYQTSFYDYMANKKFKLEGGNPRPTLIVISVTYVDTGIYTWDKANGVLPIKAVSGANIGFSKVDPSATYWDSIYITTDHPAYTILSVFSITPIDLTAIAV